MLNYFIVEVILRKEVVSKHFSEVSSVLVWKRSCVSWNRSVLGQGMRNGRLKYLERDWLSSRSYFFPDHWLLILHESYGFRCVLKLQLLEEAFI